MDEALFPLYVSLLTFILFMAGLYLGGRYNPLSVRQYRKPKKAAPKNAIVFQFVMPIRKHL